MEIDNTLCDSRYYLSMDNVNKLIATLPYIKIQKSVKQLMSPNHHDKYAYDLIEFQTRDFSINAYNFLDDCGWFCSSLYHYTDLMMIVEYCPNYISKQGNSYSMKYYISDEDVAKLRKIYHITCNDKNSIVYDDYPDNVRLTKDGDGWYSESALHYARLMSILKYCAQVNDDKVFCKDCKWIDGWTQFAPSTRKCLHEHSEIKTYHSVSGELIKDYDLCVIRNSCMHCPDFEPKEMNDEWEHCNWCEYNMLYLTRNMLYCMHPSCEFDEDGNSLTRCRDKNPDGKCKNRKERNTPCNPNLKENDNK